MALTPMVGGPRDGTDWQCACVGECQCPVVGCGLGNDIMDGYVLWQMYKKVGGVYVPSHVKKQVMICEGLCPRCGRSMPHGTKFCLNCGACMGIDFNVEDGTDVDTKET